MSRKVGPRTEHREGVDLDTRQRFSPHMRLARHGEAMAGDQIYSHGEKLRLPLISMYFSSVWINTYCS